MKVCKNSMLCKPAINSINMTGTQTCEIATKLTPLVLSSAIVVWWLVFGKYGTFIKIIFMEMEEQYGAYAEYFCCDVLTLLQGNI